jgi:formylglycine-generating enzyme required for sulfatase activity
MTEQKTVFLSYRRTSSRYLARSIYQDLTANGWDVFFDVNTIDSGDFDRIILNQIAARAHFILMISPDSLARCVNEGDWVLLEIQEAVRLNRNIVPIIEEGANFEKEISYLPADLRAVIGKKNGVVLYQDYFEAAMDKLRTRFLKTPAYVEISMPSAVERAEVQRRMAEFDAPTPSRPRSIDLMPQPFEWIDIPAGNVMLIRGDYLDYDTDFQVPAFQIAKYPITNAQFATFIEARGYHEQTWWTEAGWYRRDKENWSQPRYWTNARWNDTQQPIVGVSWYEAVAFCLWISEVTDEKIMLPTEQQWQRAAKGNDGRAYPWGNHWDRNRCNNNLGGKGSGKTTHVTLYEGKAKGDSPFGVVDMAGNVWEWCLTEHETGNELLKGTSGRVLRGGSWKSESSLDFFCDYRVWNYPSDRYNDFGFRIVLLH